MQPEAVGLGRSEFVSSRPVARQDSPIGQSKRPDVQGPAPRGADDSVKVTLSNEAQKRLAADGAASKANNSTVPPAKQARQEIAANSGLNDLPFGKVVSAIARQLDLSSLLSQTSSGTTTPTDETDEEPAQASTSTTTSSGQQTLGLSILA